MKLAGPLVDVSVHDCPSCTRLVCNDWRTCPGYLRELVDRIDADDAERPVAARLFRDDRAVT